MRDIINQRVLILQSSDPTQKGVRGRVVLETMKTLLIEGDSERVVVQKHRAIVQVDGQKEVILGDELIGRLEDRLERGRSR